MIVVVLFVLFFLGMPIAFSIITTVAGYLIVTDARPLILVAQRCYAGLDSVACLAVPLFTLAGYLMEKGGISKRLVDWVGMLLGGIRGSLGIVAVVTCTIFAALTGSGPATVCAIGGILYLPMVQSGYPEKMANGLIAAGGSLGPIIPPSIAMIVYASTMGTSITKMFAGALIPGLVISLTLCVTVYFQARKYNIPVRKEKHAFKEFLKATVNAFGVLLIPVVVLGGIYGGFVTTTEAAALACVMSLILGFLYKELNLKSLLHCLAQTVETSAMVMFIMGAAAGFTWLLNATQLPAKLVSAIVPLINGSQFLYLLALFLILLLVGALMDTLTSVVILAPILIPIGTNLGLDPLHLGVVFCVNLIVGFITPPYGINLFTVSSVTKTPFNDVVKGVLPYVVVELLCVLLFTFCPFFTTWLPSIVAAS